MLKFYWLQLVLLVIGGLPVEIRAEDQLPPSVKLDILNYVVIAELAETTATRSAGLMYRTHLPENNGMLFVFPESGVHCMWMKDTVIPLSVVFLDETKKIINLAAMVPGTLTPHCSAGASKYALEMNIGWFEKRRIKAGDAVVGIPSLSDVR